MLWAGVYRKECSGLKIKGIKRICFYALSAAFWVLLWHMASIIIDKELFLPTPARVCEALFTELIWRESFRASIAASLVHIGEGFLLGTLSGILLAVLSHCIEIVKILLWFPMKVIKSVPVASFVILSLLWMRSEKLSVFIPFLMVLPILYINTLTGLEETDEKLLDMATLFKFSFPQKALHIYIPQILPHILSACSLAVGMAWKSGIAAEIIGLAGNSIGNQLYQAKLYLMTPELFAWTIVIVLLSMICEHCIQGAALLFGNFGNTQNKSQKESDRKELQNDKTD